MQEFDDIPKESLISTLKEKVFYKLPNNLVEREQINIEKIR